MNLSLQQRVEQVRNHARSVVWCHAVGWFLSLLCLLFVVSAGIDFLLRPIDLVTRWMLTLAVLLSGFLAARHWLGNAWRFHPTLLETAQRVEQRFPQLAGQLSGSVEFLRQAEDDATAGSISLRRKAISAAEAALMPLEMEAVVNRRPRRQGLCMATCALIVLVVLFSVHPKAFGIAVGRLFMPWSAIQWPRKHYLEFVNPPRHLERGQTWEAVVTSISSTLPEQVTLELRSATGEITRHEMKFLSDQMVYRVENVTHSLEYRAFGGDEHTLPWRKLEIVEPLRVTSLQVQVHPPEYVGAAWETDSQLLTIPAGSRIEIHGQVDRPLKSMLLRGATSDTVFALALTGNRQGFTTSQTNQLYWTPPATGAYRLEWVDEHNLSGAISQIWEIRLVPDLPPVVTVDAPLEQAEATAQAQLSLRGTAKDDLAISRIALRWSQAGAKVQDAVQPLWQAEINPRRVSGSLTTGSETRTFEASWELSHIPSLKPGDILTWQIEAEDFSPQVGRSTGGKITILDPEALRAKLAQQQLAALAQLAEALKIQREVRSQVGGLETQWQSTEHWLPRDRDLLQAAELRQRQIPALTGRTLNGSATILADILREIDINRLDAAELSKQCSAWLAALGLLDRKAYPTVENHFFALLRGVKTQSVKPAEVRKELAELGKQQEFISQQLERLLSELSSWDNFQHLQRDLTQLRQLQREITTASTKLQAEILSISSPDPQQMIEAQQLARRQRELAHLLEKWLSRLADFAARSTESDATRTAQRALEVANEQAINAKMGSSAEALQAEKLGEALSRQQEIDDALMVLLDTLAGQVVPEDAKQLRALRDTSRLLEALLQDQQKLSKALADSNKMPVESQRLEDRQRELSQRTEAAAQEINRQQTGSPAGESTQAAAQAMREAAAAVKKDNSRALEQARRAEQKLAEAKQAVHNALEQRETELSQAQLVRWEQIVQGFYLRQQSLLQEAERLAKLAQQQKNKLTPAQTASLADLRSQQESLAEDLKTQRILPTLPGAFALQLEQAEGDMRTAYEFLGLEQLLNAITSQHSAESRLQFLLEALKPEPPPAAGSENSPQPPSPPQPGGDPPRQPPDFQSLAEIKLLRFMQAEINRRTMELEGKRSVEGSFPPPVAQQLVRLGDEQGRLVELSLRLVRKLALSSETNNSATPKVSDEDLLKKLDEALLPPTSPLNREN